MKLYTRPCKKLRVATLKVFTTHDSLSTISLLFCKGV